MTVPEERPQAHRRGTGAALQLERGLAVLQRLGVPVRKVQRGLQGQKQAAGVSGRPEAELNSVPRQPPRQSLPTHRSTWAEAQGDTLQALCSAAGSTVRGAMRAIAEQACKAAMAALHEPSTSYLPAGTLPSTPLT